MSYRLQFKNKNYVPGGDDATRWTEESRKALGEYSDIISKYNADAVAWRKIAVFSLALVLIAFGLLMYTVNLPETELVVIGVNDIGEARYYGKATGLDYSDYGIKKYVVQNELESYIKFTEEIPNDSQLLYNNIVRAMNYCDKDMKRKLEIEIKTRDPFSDVGRVRRTAGIETVIGLSDWTYQVDYSVVQTDMQGRDREEKKYRSVFTLNKINARQYNEMSEKERMLNPLGLFIVDMQKVEKEQ